MALFLEVLEGEQKGTRVEIRDGLIIGRREGDLTIRDSKISSQHAQIRALSEGGFQLVDLGSSNLIKTSTGRVRELSLEPGTMFTLGRTPILVLTEDIEPAERTLLANSTESRLRQLEAGSRNDMGLDDPEPDFGSEHLHDALHSHQRPPASQRQGQRSNKPSWKRTVLALIRRAAQESKFIKRDIAPFSPPLRLRFIRGIQYGSEWIVGYGPRLVGSEVADLVLEDLDLPGLCFRLIPQHSGALFQNVSKSDVLLNGRRVQSELLKDGDIIEIKSTQIQVYFDHDSGSDSGSDSGLER